MKQIPHQFFVGSLGLALAIQAFGGSFTPLGTLRDDPKQSRALDVSADGTTVVGESNVGGAFEAFRWTSDEGMVGLGLLSEGYNQSFANAVSADGSVIVGGAIDSATFDQEAFRWTMESGLVGLGDFEGGNLGSLSNGISNDGTVIVGRGSPPLQSIGFYWTSESGLVNIGDLPGGVVQSNAWGASEDGSVIVGSSHIASAQVAFRWTSEGMVRLGNASDGWDQSIAKKVTPDGTVIVGEARRASALEAFRWTEATGIVGLGFLGEGGFRTSQAHDVSADGRIVVGESISPNTFNGVEAFIWDEINGMRSLKSELETVYGLDLSNWDLEAATGISDDGTVIVGKGNLRSGDFHQEAWMAVIDPGPATSPPTVALEFSGPLKRKNIATGEATYTGVDIDDLMQGSFTFGQTADQGSSPEPGVYHFEGSAFSGTLTGIGIETNTDNTSNPVEVSFFDNIVPEDADLAIINEFLGINLPSGTQFDLAEIETRRTIVNREIEFGVSFLTTNLDLLTGTDYRTFPSLDEVELALYFVVESLNGEEVFDAIGLITEFHPQVTEITLASIQRSGANVVFNFLSQPGISSWKLTKSNTLVDGFPNDLSGLSTTSISENEDTPGTYTVEVDTSEFMEPYYLRIEK